MHRLLRKRLLTLFLVSFVFSCSLPTYAKKREDYATDLETFHDLIRQMDEHKTQLAQKVKERTVELAETEQKLQKMNAYVEDIKKTVESQELSVDDIYRMENEQKGVNEAMDRVYTSKEQSRKALLKGEEELTGLCNKLDSVMADYNAKVGELALVPKLGPKFASSKATFHKDNMLDADQSKLLGVDLQSAVRPLVLQSKTEYVEKGDQARWEYQDALDKLETAQEACNEAAAKLDIVKHKNGKCEETLEFEREAQEAKLAVRQREVEAMEDKVAALRDPVALEEQMTGYERQCAELEALTLRHKEDNIAQKKAVQDEMEAAFKLMAEHDEHCRQKLSDLDNYWMQKKAKMGQVRVPANIVLKD
jgi:kinetochore protein NDC80